jgi:hypothetical protein
MKIVLSTWLKEFYFVIGREISSKMDFGENVNYTKEQILERNGLRENGRNNPEVDANFIDYERT